MQSETSYIRDSSDFLQKFKVLGCVPQNAILVTADVVGLYPNIPHCEGLAALKEKLELRVDKKIPTSDLIQMAEFVLKNDYFEFNSKTYHQKLGTVIGTKFAPPYACIFMGKLEKQLLSLPDFDVWLWRRFIDDVIFVWTSGEEKLLEL